MESFSQMLLQWELEQAGDRLAEARKLKNAAPPGTIQYYDAERLFEQRTKEMANVLAAIAKLHANRRR